jgi:molybdopterin converting factor small subunit
MNVKIRFAGMMRTLAGRQQMMVVLQEEHTLLGLLNHLMKVLPVEFAQQILIPIINAEQQITILMVNRKYIHDRQSLEMQLNDYDLVVFVPPMEGG